MKTNDTIGWAVVDTLGITPEVTSVHTSRMEARERARNSNTMHHSKEFRIAKIVLAK